jgi:hypothetical protein
MKQAFMDKEGMRVVFAETFFAKVLHPWLTHASV